MATIFHSPTGQILYGIYPSIPVHNIETEASLPLSLVFTLKHPYHFLAILRTNNKPLTVCKKEKEIRIVSEREKNYNSSF
jgi:hypothetical protein